MFFGTGTNIGRIGQTGYRLVARTGSGGGSVPDGALLWNGEALLWNDHYIVWS